MEVLSCRNAVMWKCYHVDKLGLCKGQKFSLHYDFGGDWMFTINVTKIQEIADYHRPVVVKEKGVVEQYPSEWDEEE